MEQGTTCEVPCLTPKNQLKTIYNLTHGRVDCIYIFALYHFQMQRASSKTDIGTMPFLKRNTFLLILTLEVF